MEKSAKPSFPAPVDDKVAWTIIVLGVLMSLLIEGTTGQMEIARQGSGNIRAEWLFEITSHIGVLIASLTIPVWLNRFPLTLTMWKQRLPIYFFGFLIFACLHVLFMVGLRHMFWSLFSEGHYEFGLMTVEPWFYEMRKDAMTYLLILSVFLSSRHITALSDELQATRLEARETGRLTLKSGGRVVTLPASEIIYAKAASNYAEIHTVTGQHLVRMTLSDLEALMREARAEPVRLHRSYLTSRNVLREVTGKQAKLSTGLILPVGRVYRGQLVS